MTTLVVVRNSDGYVVAFGPNDGNYQPSVAEDCTASIEEDPVLNFEPPAPPLPIEQIRALEAPWDDDFKKIQRQYLIAALFAAAKAHPLAAGKTDAQIHAALMAQTDKGYAKLYELEQQVIPWRALIP